MEMKQRNPKKDDVCCEIGSSLGALAILHSRPMSPGYEPLRTHHRCRAVRI